VLALTLGFVTLLGLAIGSFLNVVIWRVPRGESVVSPPSACPGCGAEIRNADNVPVLGWLRLQGRCRDCREPISRRYPLVEASTGLLFLLLALVLGVEWSLPAYLYLGAVGLALALIDIDVKRLPDVLTLPSYAVMAVLLALPGLAGEGWDDYLRALLGGALMFAVYFLLCFAYPAGMGFGDVKLSGVLGMATAYIGWGAWSVGLFLGFLLGGAFGVALIALGRGGRKTKVPFGPFMLAGALVGVLVGQHLGQAYLDQFGV
jgi:leader peptidase (prepilin peptidase)/N-methyltransferase